MHVYSIDKDIRRKVILILFVISVIISVFLTSILGKPIDGVLNFVKTIECINAVLGVCGTFGVSPNFLAVPTIYALLYFIFDCKLWKNKHIIKWSGIPDLNGKWVGKLKSSFCNENEITMEMEVEQTWSKIKFVSKFPDTNSKSESDSATIFIESNGDIKVGFAFINRSREIHSQQYDGYNILEFDSVNEISGRYFNNRDNRTEGILGGNKGTFRIKRV